MESSDEDFNIPSRERRAVLERLDKALNSQAVPTPFWAACQLCDLGTLEQLIEATVAFPPVTMVAAEGCINMLLRWKQSNQDIPSTKQSSAQEKGSSPSRPAKRPRINSSSPLPAQTSSPLAAPASSPLAAQAPSNSPAIGRSQRAKEQAKKRDKYACVLTGGVHIEAAHIYPFSLLNDIRKCAIIWDTLKLFWPQPTIDAWKAEIFTSDGTGIESARNIITLRCDVHASWNDGDFALKPLESDGKTLKVQFFWQAKHPDMSAKSTTSLLKEPLTTRDRSQYRPGSELTYPVTSSHPRFIKSGDIFEITTDDEDQRPLPSMKLLEMQWFLQRVMGMAGAADIPGWEEEDDDDNDDIELGMYEKVHDWMSPPAYTGPVFAPLPPPAHAESDPMPTSDIRPSSNPVSPTPTTPEPEPETMDKDQSAGGETSTHAGLELKENHEAAA